MKRTPLKRYNKASLEKRKEERKDFPAFFQKHIQIIKEERLCCEECGCRLIGDVSEIAHALPKNYFKSIATEDLNIMYLCSWKTNGNNCHSLYDEGTAEKIKEMKIFSKSAQLYQELKSIITEPISYKTEDRYTL